MKKFNLNLIFIIMCTFLSCSKKPTACFNVLTENLMVGKIVKFQNCSSFGRGDAFWDFGDSTEINRNPLPEIDHVFHKKGEYKVSLKVILGKHTDEVLKTIIIQ